MKPMAVSNLHSALTNGELGLAWKFAGMLTGDELRLDFRPLLSSEQRQAVLVWLKDKIKTIDSQQQPLVAGQLKRLLRALS